NIGSGVVEGAMSAARAVGVTDQMVPGSVILRWMDR
uniref:Uncharacterized protein n=1 Tax=Plectus sambesii TaxID=2011161 RepID=A0A914XP86_9BILA